MLKKTRFQSCKDIIKKNEGGAQEHSRGEFQEELPKVAEALERVCAFASGAF